VQPAGSDTGWLQGLVPSGSVVQPSSHVRVWPARLCLSENAVQSPAHEGASPPRLQVLTSILHTSGNGTARAAKSRSSEGVAQAPGHEKDWSPRSRPIEAIVESLGHEAARPAWLHSSEGMIGVAQCPGATPPRTYDIRDPSSSQPFPMLEPPNAPQHRDAWPCSENVLEDGLVDLENSGAGRLRSSAHEDTPMQLQHMSDPASDLLQKDSLASEVDTGAPSFSSVPLPPQPRLPLPPSRPQSAESAGNLRRPQVPAVPGEVIQAVDVLGGWPGQCWLPPEPILPPPPS